MKSLFLFLISSACFCSELLNYRELDPKFYNIILYKMDNPYDSFKLKLKPVPSIQIYENKKLDGKPAFIIDNFRIVSSHHFDYPQLA